MAVKISDIQGDLVAQFSAEGRQSVLALDVLESLDPVSRVAIVDQNFTQTAPPYFKNVQDAVDWARSKVSNDGGRATVKVFYDLNGDPLSPNLQDYSWYIISSEDDKIQFESGVRSGDYEMMCILSGKDVDLNKFLNDFNVDNFTVDINLNG